MTHNLSIQGMLIASYNREYFYRATPCGRKGNNTAIPISYRVHRSL